jgi:hypothetical protein
MQGTLLRASRLGIQKDTSRHLQRCTNRCSTILIVLAATKEQLKTSQRLEMDDTVCILWLQQLKVPLPMGARSTCDPHQAVLRFWQNTLRIRYGLLSPSHTAEYSLMNSTRASPPDLRGNLTHCDGLNSTPIRRQATYVRLWIGVMAAGESSSYLIYSLRSETRIGFPLLPIPPRSVRRMGPREGKRFVTDPQIEITRKGVAHREDRVPRLGRPARVGTEIPRV